MTSIDQDISLCVQANEYNTTNIRVGEAVREVEHVELFVGRRRGQPPEVLGAEDHVACRARQRALTRTCGSLGSTLYTGLRIYEFYIVLLSRTRDLRTRQSA